MKLLIISHTEHYKNLEGQIVGWGPTLTEINHLASIFDEIYHIGAFKNEAAPPSALPYTSPNIHFIPTNATGGKYLYQKLNIIWNAPSTIYKVFKTLKKVDVFQLRAPTGIGVYLIPFLTFFSRKKGWFKYAGNWVQVNAPFGYSIQRWFLKKQKRIVTINGKWKNQLTQCRTFENPCLVKSDQIEGLNLIEQKEFKIPYTFCFAGRLEDPKGVKRIIEAFTILKNKDAIKRVHMIGNGVKIEEYKELAKNSGVEFIFHGFLSYLDVFEIYKKSHFFLLPSSASEGFPKVIAEAMNFGCIPIVSNISSIGQYVKNDINGYIVEPNTSVNLGKILNEIIENKTIDTNKMLSNNHDIASLFTYERYLNRIKNEIAN